MSQFDLSVAFTNEQLQTLYATGTNVVVAKPTQGGQPNVAWQVFRPLQANNLSWEEQYGIYASTSSVTNGAALTQLSATPFPAVIAQLYALEASGAVSGPASGGTDNAYSMINKYDTPDKFLTIGLFQNASVNGVEIIGNAVSAAPVLLQSTAVMTPFTTVYIWLQSQVSSNSVVTDVTSPMTRLVFGGGVDSHSVAYDSNTGTFLPAGGSGGSAKLVEHVFPRL